jgi:hypothetical protein
VVSAQTFWLATVTAGCFRGCGCSAVSLVFVCYTRRLKADFFVFSSRNYTKALRDTLDRDATVDGKGKLILLDLLDRHPRAAAKKGVGVASLTFGEHPTFKGTQCFMINRTDGTQEDFSFRKCIQAIFPDSASRGGGKSRGNNSQHKRGREGGDKSSARDSNKKHKPSSMLVAGGEALTLVKVENLPLGVRWSDLKKEVEVYGKVNYVQRIERGSTSTVLQMSQSSDVGAVVASFQSMDGKELVVHALTKEEEDKYFQDHHQGGQGKSGAAVGVVKKE